jgi:hypothetical protein
MQCTRSHGKVGTVTANRATEVRRLVAAAHRASPDCEAARSLAQLADEQWHLAAAFSDSRGRQRTALLRAEQYARAAFLAAGGSETTVLVPQD